MGDCVEVSLPHGEEVSTPHGVVTSDVIFRYAEQLWLGMGRVYLLYDLTEYEPIASHMERPNAERAPAVTPC